MIYWSWTVAVMPSVVHFNSEIYENPLEFNPWRWTGKDYYRLLVARLNQESLRLRQEEQQHPYGDLNNERSRLYNSLTSRRRDYPSNQTKPNSHHIHGRETSSREA